MADAKTTFPPLMSIKNSATSLASYLGSVSDLYVFSCSSSIITRPKLLKGKNNADLGPIATFISPFFIEYQKSYFSPTVILEWNIPISICNLPFILSTICGVREISGTNIIVSLPFFKFSSINLINTSVFPLPVTPWIRNLL